MKKFLLLALLAAAPAHAADLKGVLKERGTRKPLGGVNIYVLPDKIKAVSDPEGRFEIKGVADGDFQWVVVLTGYERLERKDSTAIASQGEVELFLERSTYFGYETTVYGKQKKRDAQTKSLSREQFATLPGSGGDPVKAVQNFAGVNRAASFDAQVLIQGSGPQDTRYTVDGHEVPVIFHFGGLSSVIFPEALDRVDYLSAGYGPEFGRAMGGLVGVWTRPPQTDRYHGLGYIDIFNAGLLVEGPLTESKNHSLLLSARKSYIGEVLRPILDDNDDFNLTVAPGFADLTGIYQAKVTPRDDFRVVTLASEDTLEFLLKQPADQDPEFRGDFSTRTAFFRVIPQLTHRHSPRTTSRWSLAAGKSWIRVENEETFFRLGVHGFTFRGEVERKMVERKRLKWTMVAGLDNSYRWATVDLSLPDFQDAGGVNNPFSVGERRQTQVSDEYPEVGVFMRNSVEIGKLTLIPNVRFDHVGFTDEQYVSPRPAARYLLMPGLELRTAGGLYYQPAEEWQAAPDTGNPELVSPRAWHLTFGAEKDFRETTGHAFTLSGDVFYKALQKLVTSSTRTVERGGELVPENFQNDGKGRVYGFQTNVRYDQKPWMASLAYTIAKSTRWSSGRPEYPFAYDQTHLIGLIGSYEVGSWKFSSRFRYSTGNPFTPVTGGVFDSDNDVYIPTRGAFYSERFEPFLQLDLRIDHKWVFDTWILSAYLDVQNVTNRKNPEQVIYAYDYSKRTTLSGLPVLPTFGLKGEF